MNKKRKRSGREQYKEIFKLAKEIVRLKKFRQRPLRVRHECTACRHVFIAWMQEATCRMCGSCKLSITFATRFASDRKK